MDQDLITYLDRRFGAIDSRFDAIDSRFEAIDSRFEAIDSRFEAIDTRFEAIDTRFEAIDSRFANLEVRLSQEVGGLREEMNRRFEEAAETARHTLVVVEDLRDEVHLIAEAHLGLRDQVKTRESEVDLKLSQTEASVEPYYRDLNSRVRVLEGWRDRQQDDVTDAVRKVLEKHRRQQEVG